MADIICIIMGIIDIIAGILILLSFSGSVLAIIFGAIMIGKGGFSFI
jgi:hypothetical protein